MSAPVEAATLRVAWPAVLALSLTPAACAGLVGIQSIHDDPADGGAQDSGGDRTVDAPTEAEATDSSAAEGASGDDGATDADMPIDGGTTEGAVEAGPDPLTGCTSDAAVTVFVQAAGNVLKVAIDSTYLYAGSSQGIRRCSITGCGSALPQVLSNDIVDSIASNGRDLVWTDTASPASLVVATPDGTRLGGELITYTGSVAVSGQDVWVITQGGSLYHLADTAGGVGEGGTEFTSMPAYPSDQAIAASNTDVAFTSPVDGGSYIYVCPATGCPDTPAPMLFVNQGNLSSAAQPLLALTDTTLYFTDPSTGDINACPVTGCVGAPTSVATAVRPSALFAAPEGLYWGGRPSGSTNVLERIPFDGGSPTQVAVASDFPKQIVSNGKCVYWTQVRLTPPFVSSVFAAPVP